MAIAVCMQLISEQRPSLNRGPYLSDCKDTVCLTDFYDCSPFVSFESYVEGRNHVYILRWCISQARIFK